MNENELLSRITVNPRISGGKPIIRGRRLAVEHVLGMLAAGDTTETILEGYPWLEAEDVQACLVYAAKTPRAPRKANDTASLIDHGLHAVVHESDAPVHEEAKPTSFVRLIPCLLPLRPLRLRGEKVNRLELHHSQGESSISSFSVGKRLQDEIKWVVLSPTIDVKVTVQGQNATGLVLISHVHQTGIRKIHRHVRIFLQQSSQRRCLPGHAVGNQKGPVFDIFQDGIRGVLDFSHEVAGLRDDGFAGEEGGFDFCANGGAFLVMPFRAVQQGDNEARVQEHWSQRPNPFRWVLLEPRSGMPDLKRPRPSTRRGPRAVSPFKTLIPSRTT